MKKVDLVGLNFHIVKPVNSISTSSNVITVDGWVLFCQVGTLFHRAHTFFRKNIGAQNFFRTEKFVPWIRENIRD